MTLFILLLAFAGMISWVVTGPTLECKLPEAGFCFVLFCFVSFSPLALVFSSPLCLHHFSQILLTSARLLFNVLSKTVPNSLFKMTRMGVDVGSSS